VNGPTVSAVVTAHDRRAFLPEAVASALASGADEVVVVRNFSGPIDGVEGRYRDVPCAAEETGVKEAVGLEAAVGEVVAFLDDDDTWDPAKVPHVRELFGGEPALVYYCHDQVPVDRSGRPAEARHREWARTDPARFAKWDGRDLRTLFREIWPGNNSSTVVRRRWGISWTAALREAGWAADRFWVAAALIDHRPMRLEDAPLTRLRLHDQNMSQARSASPEEFRRRHAVASARFARSFRTLARIASERGGPDSPIARHFGESAAAFGFFADLENDVRPRRAALSVLRRGPGWIDRAVLGSALLALASPGLARRLLYRSSLRRWKLG
jgi:Glycosyl transferase family 2